MRTTIDIINRTIHVVIEDAAENMDYYLGLIIDETKTEFLQITKQNTNLK